jgi:hypothetical protein
VVQLPNMAPGVVGDMPHGSPSRLDQMMHWCVTDRLPTCDDGDNRMSCNSSRSEVNLNPVECVPLERARIKARPGVGMRT